MKCPKCGLEGFNTKLGASYSLGLPYYSYVKQECINGHKFGAGRECSEIENKNIHWLNLYKIFRHQ